MEKETVNWRQASTCQIQKQKATYHVDEELRLAIFKTLKLSQVSFFLILLEFQDEDLIDIGRRVSRSFAG